VLTLLHYTLLGLFLMFWIMKLGWGRALNVL